MLPATIALKQQGNDAFAAQNYAAADALYLQALLLQFADQPLDVLAEERAVLHANRSASLAALKRWPAALDEAELACRLRPTWSKAHFRRGQALEGMRRLTEAAHAYELAVSNDTSPSPALIRKQKQVAVEAKKDADEPLLARIKAHVEATKTAEGCPVPLALSMFKVLDGVGEGNYSSVQKVQFTLTGEVFALKTVDKKKAERLAVRHGNIHQELRMERRLLSKLSHANLVKLLLSFQDASNLYFVSEFVAGKELWHKLRLVPPPALAVMFNNLAPAAQQSQGLVGLRPSVVPFYLAQLINALVYLESQGVVHRDLKPENVMVQPSADGTCERLKLIDFGSARDRLDVPPKQETELVAKNKLQSAPSHFVGTPEFMSPEAIHGKLATHRSDLWSLGCSAFQLYTGRTPFKGASDYFTFLKADAAAYQEPSHLAGRLESHFIASLLKVDPDQRPASASELKRHPLFSAIDFAALENPDVLPEVPAPTAAELQAQVIGVALWTNAEHVGQGPLSKAKKLRFVAVDAVPVPERTEDAEVLRLLKAWLEHRRVLSAASTLDYLSVEPNAWRLSRVHGHAFVGHSQQEEGRFKESFVVAVVGPVVQGADVAALVAKLNQIAQLRLVVVAGMESALQLTELSRDVAVAVAPVAKIDAYYSLWVGGCLFIVLNGESIENDNAQWDWLDAELQLGKLCARNVIVVSSRPWLAAGLHVDTADALAKPEPERFVGAAVQRRFLREMQESGVKHLVVVGAATATAAMARVGKTEPLEAPLMQTETPPATGADVCVRVVRVMPTTVVSDLYATSELPDWFALEKEDDAEVASDSGAEEF